MDVCLLRLFAAVQADGNLIRRILSAPLLQNVRVRRCAEHTTHRRVGEHPVDGTAFFWGHDSFITQDALTRSSVLVHSLAIANYAALSVHLRIQVKMRATPAGA